VSVGLPMHWDDVKDALYPDTAEAEDFGYERVARLLRLVGGGPASTFSGREGVVEEWSDRWGSRRGSATGSGTAAAASARPGGRASTG
jgi:hypothetical protein